MVYIHLDRIFADAPDMRLVLVHEDDVEKMLQELEADDAASGLGKWTTPITTALA